MALSGAVGGCAAVLGIDPTEVVGADGTGEGGIVGEGGATGKGEAGAHPSEEGGTGDTPAFNASCGKAIATLDASGQEASSIVADADGVFWAIPEDSSTSLIYANFGSGNQLVVGSSDGTSTNDEPTILSLALDSTHLYWSSWNTYAGATDPAHLRSWSRLGSHPIAEVNLSATGPGISQITLAGGFIYWGNWKAANADLWRIGAGFEDNAAPISTPISGGLISPFHFASDGVDKVYYDEPLGTGSLDVQKQVALVSVAMGGANEVETGADNVEDLAVDEAGRVYWTDTDVGKISTHASDRSTATSKLTDIAYPHLLSYDADHHFLYVANSSQENVYSVQRIPTMGSDHTPEMCVDHLLDVSGINYFAGHVYFSAASDSGSALFDLTTNDP